MNAAVFVDFENLYLSLKSRNDGTGVRTRELSLQVLEGMLARLRNKGHPILVGRSYAAFDTYPGAPVVTTGALSGTGDAKIDGEVDNALDMIERLASSSRVRQSIIRHAFRFFMGRNEMLSDSETLIEADKAYVDSGGSFRAVVISLLSSDSFIYRKETKD